MQATQAGEFPDAVQEVRLIPGPCPQPAWWEGQQHANLDCGADVPVGLPLEERDYAALAARWIDEGCAVAAGLRRVDTHLGGELIGRNGNSRYEGIAIPYIWPGEELPREYRLRRDHPEYENGKPKNKYLSPPGRSSMVYFAPGTDPAWLQNQNIPIVITEGEFKAIALMRAAWYGVEGESPRFLPVSFPGVWNWQGNIGKVLSPDGTRVNEKGPIPDLKRIDWTGRQIVIAFDRDAETNDGVRAARYKLTQELRSRSAVVRNFQWPAEGPEAKGIDDLLAALGPEVVLPLIESQQEVESGGVAGVDWKSALMRSRSDIPLGNLANAITALQSAPVWRGVLAWNSFARRVCATSDPPFKCGDTWGDQETRLTCNWLQRQGIQVGVQVATDAVLTVAGMRSFHPVRDYLGSIGWDGVNRLNNWLETYLQARISWEEDEDFSDYLRAVGRCWMISAVARIYQPGCQADHCLVLEAKQGSGKSSALKDLAGEWFTDHLAALGTKDAAQQLEGVWIVELAELDALKKSEVSATKAFITCRTDRFRAPFERTVEAHNRQMIFGGSTNDSTWLKDDTGNRRFWPVKCGVIDRESLRRDRDQLWAEAVALYRAGEPWWITDPRIVAAAERQQNKRVEVDVWDTAIFRWIENQTPSKDSTGAYARIDSSDDYVSVRDILVHALKLDEGKISRMEQTRVASILVRRGWERHQKRINGERMWMYFRPDVVS